MISLDHDEKLIKIYRKHNFYIGIKIFGLILMGLVPFLLYPFFESLIPGIFGTSSIYLSIWIYSMYLTILWVIGFVLWTEYYLDMWVLTDKRLIDVEQIGLFSREISSLRLDRIQDVKVETLGVLNTILHIGTLHVQTAGSEKEFIIPAAKSPHKAKAQIMSFHHDQVEAIKTVRVENS